MAMGSGKREPHPGIHATDGPAGKAEDGTGRRWIDIPGPWHLILRPVQGSFHERTIDRFIGFAEDADLATFGGKVSYRTEFSVDAVPAGLLGPVRLLLDQ
jgi:hypothetical protein